MLSDLTLIVPTHNRHKYLKRILTYYSVSKLNIIVADSTSTPFEFASSFNIQYCHYPDLSFLKKMNRAVNLIKTKYSFICADDDFIVLSSVLECVKFLEKNPEYSSAQGHWINFNSKEGKVAFSPDDNFPRFIGIDINNEKPSDRIDALFESYMFLFYSTHRTINLVKTFESSDKFSNEFTGTWQFFLDIVVIINGKHKILPVFYGAREIMNFSARHVFPDIHFMENFSSLEPQYKLFVKLLANHLATKEDIDETTAYDKINTVLLPHNLSYIKPIPAYLSNPVPLPFKKLVNRLPNISGLKKKYSNMVYEMINPLNNFKMRSYKSRGFPIFNQKARGEWKEIKRVISAFKIN